MLNKGILDKDLFPTDDEGAKRSFTSHTPVITVTKPEEIKPEKETLKALKANS